MDDPTMKELPPDIDRLLDGERGNVPAAPDGARRRVLSRVETTLGLPAVAAAAALAAEGATPVAASAPVAAASSTVPAAAAAVATGTAGLSVAAKAALWLGALAVGAGGFTGIYLASRGPSDPAPAPSTSVTLPGAPAAPGALVAPPPAPAAAVTPPASPVAVPSDNAALPRLLPKTHPAVHQFVGDLAAENDVLQIARQALTRGDSASALAATRLHQRRFPRGQLAEERENLAIRALAASGDRAAAATRAAAFRERYPESVYLPAVEALLK